LRPRIPLLLVENLGADPDILASRVMRYGIKEEVKVRR